jgi:hypothetical protein
MPRRENRRATRAETRRQEAAAAARDESPNEDEEVRPRDLGVTVGAALVSAGVRWDDRIWRARGELGRVDYRSVYRLKLWWNHNGSGEVITRSIRALVDKVAARLARFPVKTSSIGGWTST